MTSLLIGAAAAAKHAVLVAGSSGWENYRHQADIAHAYTILASGGVPAENIITMMYDDVAHSLWNPFRGKLYNQPDNATGAPAVDVYAAVKDHIDYRKGHVTPHNFLKVLTGDKSAPGRVLESGPEDDVFVYFADHGAVGLLAFPNVLGVFPVRSLHADQLNDAFKTMKSKGMFKRLVFYTEACESGSMFDGILNASLGVYAVTAANAHESSYGWYCGGTTGANKVHGKSIGVCLGDEFSVRWMEDTDAADESRETLDAQFDAVQHKVTKSHVMRFGNLSFVASPLEAFLGDEKNASRLAAAAAVAGGSGVDSRDSRLHWLRWRLHVAQQSDSSTVEELLAAERAVATEEASRRAATARFTAVWARVSGLDQRALAQTFLPPRRFECHRAVAREAALQYTDFSLQYHRVVVNLCEMGFTPTAIAAAFRAVDSGA